MRNLITNSSEVVAGDVPAGVDEELLVAMAGAAETRVAKPGRLSPQC
jgi:hypothetical protein